MSMTSKEFADGMSAEMELTPAEVVATLEAMRQEMKSLARFAALAYHDPGKRGRVLAGLESCDRYLAAAVASATELAGEAQ